MALIKINLALILLIYNLPCCLPYDPDLDRTLIEMIMSKGYECEEHYATTEDGFILGMQRINTNQTEKSNHGKPVAFLLHGLIESSSTWVINLPHQSLGFILADAGFDVWLGNIRGNTYSKRHKTYRNTDPSFWDWSWDEMAKYDLPAMIEYVYRETKQPINYIGFSQGTLTAFSAFSTNERLASMVKKFVALGPVATVAHIGGFIQFLAKFSIWPEKIFNLLGVKEFLPSSPWIKWIASNVCKALLLKKICSIPVIVGGMNCKNVNETRLPVYVAHTPAGTSVKNMVHFAQMYHSKKYVSYDYKGDNVNFYNMTSPPAYNISNAKVPTYIFHGSDDKLSPPEDVKFITDNLPNLKRVTKIDGYQHLDFVWGLDARSRIYNVIVDILLH